MATIQKTDNDQLDALAGSLVDKAIAILAHGVQGNVYSDIYEIINESGVDVRGSSAVQRIIEDYMGQLEEEVRQHKTALGHTMDSIETTDGSIRAMVKIIKMAFGEYEGR